MEKAYLAPRLFKVYVTFPNERTSYSEPVSHTHQVGGAVHSLSWAKHIGKVAAGYDGDYEVFEHDCGDWIRVIPDYVRLDEESPSSYVDFCDEFPW